MAHPFHKRSEELAEKFGSDGELEIVGKKQTANEIQKPEASNEGGNNKSKELLGKLETGIKETMNSESYKAFLKMQSFFHNYSFNNAMLIFMQRPDATRVAGFNTWKKLERYVMKGEKGISILAPNQYKFEKYVDKMDAKTNKPIKDPKTGEIIKEKVEATGLTFRPVTVFDVKQTGGKELPEICNELQGNSFNAESIIKAIKKIAEVPIVEKNIESGAKGYYSRGENIIAIQQDMSLDQTAKTLIHEYAHSQLHNTEAGAALNKATKEVQAESVAFIVSERFGVDTSEYSFEYIANWSSGKELSELKKSFDIIQKTANKTIQAIEDTLSNELIKSEVIDTNKNIDVPSYKMFYSGEQNKQAIDFQKDTGYKRVWIPESQGGNGDMWAVYKDINILPKWIQNYASNQEACGQNVDINNVNIKDKIINLYSKEFPAIKHVSGTTANIIDNLNKTRENPYSIKGIKRLYKDAGKKYEASNEPEDKEAFFKLQNIVDDIKKAQIQEKINKAQENTALKQIKKDMELVQ